jgi:hypothetical protein
LKGTYKLEEKEDFLCDLVYAAWLAHQCGGCIRFSMKPGRHGSTKSDLQVLKTMVDAGFLWEIRSPPGSPKMSRFLLLPTLRRFFPLDPWELDSRAQTIQLVFLRPRKDKDNPKDLENLPFDPEQPTAKKVRRGLKLVNAVNSRSLITYTPSDLLGLTPSEAERTVRLRPIHVARFTDNFDLHGRIYTDQYGHQPLRKKERETIRFDGAESVEVDFSGMHTRMIYHLVGIDYRDDPYALWGPHTTEAQRLLAKLVMNTAINAESRNAAISACLFKKREFTGKEDAAGRPIRKTGRALRKAQKLQEALDETGLTFPEVYALALERHPRIRPYFGSDMGIKLMRYDSTIALDVLSYFAQQGIPCLGVHDSFIVPKQYKTDLREAMVRFYTERFRFPPVLK